MINKTTHEFIAEVLLCPNSGKPIRMSPAGLRGRDGEILYPELMNVPFVFRNTQHHILQWSQKIQSVMAYYREQHNRAQRELGRVDQLPATRQRLVRLSEAYKKSELEFKNLFSLFPQEHQQTTELSPFFFERIPRQQTVMAYYQTVFRDWVWGENEILAQVEALHPYLCDTKKLLTLGAGACGMPARLHDRLSGLEQLAVDVNPVLFYFARKVFTQSEFEAVEYPVLPKNLESACIEHKVKGYSQPNGFHMMLADAQNLEFSKNVFDTVLTPWFVDIIPRDFRETARGLNQHLQMGGRWVHIGPLAFERLQLSELYSPQEVEECLKESGFRLVEMKSVSVPYLSSPYSCIKREDEVFLFVAEKVKVAKKPTTYEYLPDWLRDWSVPVPLQPEIQNLSMKSQVYAQVLSCVDGQANLEQIASRFAIHHRIDLQAAKNSIGHFFTNIFEQHIFREF